MTRCQHCKKLTHSEHMNVYFPLEDLEKIRELSTSLYWVPKWQYEYPNLTSPNELGLLIVGDIKLHFIAATQDELKPR